MQHISLITELQFFHPDYLLKVIKPCPDDLAWPLSVCLPGIGYPMAAGLKNL
jgi:hypothetical protein